MPYELDCNKDGCYVMNKKTGKRHSEKRMPKRRAMAQMRALYMAEGDKKDEKEFDYDLFIAEKDHSGAMVALMIPDEIAQQLAISSEGALPASELHITLAYLGDVDNADLEKSAVMTAVGSFANYASPIKGNINGVGRFMNDDEEGQAYYASFDSPHLPDDRQRLVEELSVKNIPVAHNHGFTPHITLAYLPPGSPSPDIQLDPIQVTFDKVVVAWGDERHEFKLDGPMPMSQPSMKSSQFFAFKQDDGTHRWIMFSSNAFQDREKEIVSLKALEADVTRADQDGNYGPLRWWHVGEPDPVAKKAGPGVDLGDCDFNAMHGRILIESGTFRNEEVGAAVAHKADSLGVSIGFFHPKDEPDKEGVFHNIYRFERSLLPKSRASNPFTSLLVTKESEMNDEKLKQLRDDILGGNEELTSQVLSWAEQTDKTAEKSGFSFKEWLGGVLKKDEPEQPDTATKDEPEGDETNFVGDLSPEKFKELQDASFKEMIAPLVADIAAFKDEQAVIKDGQDAVKQALTDQATTLKKIGERVDELEGETPRSQKGYRPSQDDETVIENKDHHLKDAKPHVDPAFENFLFSNSNQ